MNDISKIGTYNFSSNEEYIQQKLNFANTEVNSANITLYRTLSHYIGPIKYRKFRKPSEVGFR